MSKALSLLSNRQALLTALLSAIATSAIYIAQASSSSCMFFTYEQPKMPKSLIKMD